MQCIYELKYCPTDILLGHSVLQLRSIVIFDNLVVLVARFFWFFVIIAYYYVINLIDVYNFWLDLCGAVPVAVLRVFLGNVTSFWSTFVLGGGVGGNVTFHGIRFPAGILIINICHVLLGHIRMWRDSLSRDSRVVCLRAS